MEFIDDLRYNFTDESGNVPEVDDLITLSKQLSRVKTS